MQKSKVVISQALNTIVGNLRRTGDPLGVKSVYWTHWTNGLNLAEQGKTVLFTARMYQMLPYLEQMIKLSAKAQPGAACLQLKPVAKLAEAIESIGISPMLRLCAHRSKLVHNRAENALKGIATSLKVMGIEPAFLYKEEPYSGILLHDLGVEDEASRIALSVFETFQRLGIQTVITVDPHTTYMLRKIYPRLIDKFDLNICHYLELINQAKDHFQDTQKHEIPEKVVMHDSCVMSRDLEIIDEPRKVLDKLGIQVLEPENTGLNTACCGGPIEYAYTDLSSSISYNRAKELASMNKDVVVTCPICLINMLKYENELGLRVWDLGEILFKAQKDRSR